MQDCFQRAVVHEHLPKDSGPAAQAQAEAQSTGRRAVRTPNTYVLMHAAGSHFQHSHRIRYMLFIYFHDTLYGRKVLGHFEVPSIESILYIKYTK